MCEDSRRDVSEDKLEETSSDEGAATPVSATEAPEPDSEAASAEPGAPDQGEEPVRDEPQQEKLTYTRPDGVSIDVPVYRAGMPDMFVALQPPQANPYLMAPRDARPEDIVQFFEQRVAQVEDLRVDMLKRYSKSPSLKCRFQTGDVAYVMGRPFQLRVYPLGQPKERPKSGARGRTTSKFSIDPGISLLTLYVVHPRNYDEAKLAFNGYAEGVIMRNAVGLAGDFMAVLAPGAAVPPVRMRAMRDRWSSDEAGALWLSTDLIPYPPDCLVYTIWRELEKRATIPEEQVREQFERILPGWRQARQMLVDRVEPYSLQ